MIQEQNFATMRSGDIFYDTESACFVRLVNECADLDAIWEYMWTSDIDDLCVSVDFPGGMIEYQSDGSVRKFVAPRIHTVYEK